MTFEELKAKNEKSKEKAAIEKREYRLKEREQRRANAKAVVKEVIHGIKRGIVAIVLSPVAIVNKIKKYKDRKYLTG